MYRYKKLNEFIKHSKTKAYKSPCNNQSMFNIKIRIPAL